MDKVGTNDNGMSKIKNLVFEGGGIRGLAFGGSVKYLEEMDVMKNVKGLAGSSAGSIIAAGLAVGYNSKDIISIMSDTDFEDFKDDSWGIMSDIWRLKNEYGFYKGDKFHGWIKSLLEQKSRMKDPTFKDIYDKFGITLIITGCCLNKGTTYYFSHTNPKYEDMSVALAVRISMSIPLFWKAVNLDGDIMVDGGVLDNYPIWVFDTITDDITDDITDEPTKSKHPETLGFKLMTKHEHAGKTPMLPDDKIDGLVSYFKALLGSMMVQIERGHIRDDYWKRTVCIDTGDISSLHFNITQDEKNFLIEQGYESARAFFSHRNN